MGSRTFAVMAVLAQRELGVTRERITDSQLRTFLRLIAAGEPAAQIPRDLGMSRATLYRWIRELPFWLPSKEHRPLAGMGPGAVMALWGFSVRGLTLT